MAVRAGKLRKQIAIQATTRSTDTMGGYTDSWATSATVWGSIDMLSGRELVEAQKKSARATHRIVIRYRSDITVRADRRLLWNSRAFNILSVMNPDERNELQDILAEEIVL